MDSRADAARRFAGVLGWVCYGSIPGRPKAIALAEHNGAPIVWVPEPDAPLHEHLAFVGRVAEAIGEDAFVSVERIEDEIVDDTLEVTWRVMCSSIGIAASDLSWAALLAAAAAKEVDHG